MARKLPRLQRVLDAPALASVAYGEVASSIYFALGIVALHALGLTPVVLGVVGVLFLVVTLSYAEGTTTIGEAGGAATFVRVAFNDLAGFVTGWALFLDYLIVIALSALFFPHYLGLALGWHSIAQHPGDVIVGCVLIGVIALVRLLRPTRLYSFSLAVPVLDLVTQLLLVLLGFAFLFSPNALTHGLHVGTQPSWHQVAFALPLAFLAYTGLETVANLAEETRRPRTRASGGLPSPSPSTASYRAASAGSAAAAGIRRKRSSPRLPSRSPFSSRPSSRRIRWGSSPASSASASWWRSPRRSSR